MATSSRPNALAVFLISQHCLSRVMLVLLVLLETKVLLASRVCLVNVVLLVCLVLREKE